MKHKCFWEHYRECYLTSERPDVPYQSTKEQTRRASQAVTITFLKMVQWDEMYIIEHKIISSYNE
jgi:hypothetical protein